MQAQKLSNVVAKGAKVAWIYEWVSVVFRFSTQSNFFFKSDGSGLVAIRSNTIAAALIQAADGEFVCISVLFPYLF